MKALRRLLWRALRAALFLLDAERAHRVTIRLIRVGAVLGGAPLRVASGVSKAEDSAPVRVLGMEFSSRVGLAAGFDKDCEIVAALPDLGFGFAEIGTVTPKSQGGNERPRLFRDVAALSIFNRMGFNNLGARVVAEHLSRARDRLPPNFRVGVNVGKSRETDAQGAPSDYALAAAPFAGLVDYVVVNVSSPNTPGLRDLQRAEALLPILEAVNRETAIWLKRPPLLVKLAPEAKLAEIVRALEGRGVEGWILTNTLAGRFERAGASALEGGWSGSALAESSRRALAEVRAVTKAPIVSVGGIISVDEAVARVRAGADLVQIYSGWIFSGPEFPIEVSRAVKKFFMIT